MNALPDIAGSGDSINLISHQFISSITAIIGLSFDSTSPPIPRHMPPFRYIKKKKTQETTARHGKLHSECQDLREHTVPAWHGS